MSEFDSLTVALEGWFDTTLNDLPDTIRARVEREFFPASWHDLSSDQRRSLALQMDYPHDPAMEAERKHLWDFFVQLDRLCAELKKWELVSAPTASDLAIKEARLQELRREIARREKLSRQAPGGYSPKGNVAKNRYIPYPRAMSKFLEKLGAAPEEVAAWIFMGPNNGGIAAYRNANELDPPPRFFFDHSIEADYLSSLMGCWFAEDEVERFEPGERYITGAELIERWSKQPGIRPEAFIRAKIEESRLSDLHPTFGLTQGSVRDYPGLPSLAEGLFALPEIEQIERDDLSIHSVAATSEGLFPVVGSPEWRRQNASKAANALHDQPGGSRDKQRKIVDIWMSGKFNTRERCAEQECAALGMSFSAARKALTNAPEPPKRLAGA